MNDQQGTYLYTVDVPLRWSDMDVFGHVNNSMFFTYFEQARIEWWNESNLPNLALEKTVPVIVHASCTYLKPIVYPELISIKVSVDYPGKTSYDSFYEIHSKNNPDTLYAKGTTKIVWIDRATMRPTPLPDYLIELFQKYIK